MLKTSKFNRHEKSHSHRIALASMLESAGMWAGGEGSETVAPSEKDFETVFHHTVMHPVGKGARDAAKGKKTRKMLWCLAESHREKKRRLWSDCAELSMTLMQDVRNGRLNARYVCCTDRMVHVSGYLSTVNLARDFSLDSIGIQKGTLEHLRCACTSCVAPPYNDRQIPSSFDEPLHAKLTRSIESFVADSAYDEIKAGKMLAGQEVSPETSFPNMHLVSRDKPHAVRRNITRNINADNFLKDVSGMFVWYPDSPTKLIQFSVYLSFLGWPGGGKTLIRSLVYKR